MISKNIGKKKCKNYLFKKKVIKVIFREEYEKER